MIHPPRFPKMTRRGAQETRCRAQPACASLLLAASVCGLLACGDIAGTATLPAGQSGPETYNTPAGAVGLYHGTKYDKVLQAVADYVLRESGELTDELAANERAPSAASIGGGSDPLDARLLPESQAGDVTAAGLSYAALQAVRNSARQAIGLLAAYAPDSSPALRGELYGLAAYAEVLLADLYCSGVPLSTLDYGADFTYRPGSSTQDVYRHAVALADTALVLSADSLPALQFARVVKGRALLALGAYDSAARAVAAVPTDFRYVRLRTWSVLSSNATSGFRPVTVADREGGVGLPFVTGGDPRIVLSTAPEDTNRFGAPRYAPAQYAEGMTSPIVLASGVEARLIEAEAQLHANGHDGAWLATINALRTSCTDAASCPTPAPVGMGGVAGLPPLTDPGTDTGRVRLLFAERGYWLFLTAHRQGDLRRLVRPTYEGGYGWSQAQVYPSGAYFGGSGRYGFDVTLPIPSSERANPYFRGCLSREP